MPAASCQYCGDGEPAEWRRGKWACARCAAAFREACAAPARAGRSEAAVEYCGKCRRRLGAALESDVAPRCRCAVVSRVVRPPGKWRTDARPLWERAAEAYGRKVG